jgi:hypothetical protein
MTTNQPNAMFTFGLLPTQEIISVYSDENGNLIDPPEGQLIPLIKLPKPETAGWWSPELVWFDDRVERRWVESSPPPPGPDWLGFAGWLYVFPPIAAAMEAARLSTNPQGEPATTGLPAALQEARLNQNYPAWAATWGQFLLASGMSLEPLTEIVGKATAYHLPAEFIAALQPPPPPES